MIDLKNNSKRDAGALDNRMFREHKKGIVSLLSYWTKFGKASEIQTECTFSAEKCVETYKYEIICNPKS
jgi:hypothetical protein